jgi:hypothetical protein
VTDEEEDIFVINGFYMAMRGKYCTTPARVRWFVVEWDASSLPWADFRGVVLGATDPAAAATGSLRRKIYERWEELGLPARPDTGDNGVHASASPFEGLCERMNWLGGGGGGSGNGNGGGAVAAVGDDPFGRALLGAGVPAATVEAWRSDPQVPFEGSQRSIFDLLEDNDADACLAKARAVVAAAGVASGLGLGAKEEEEEEKKEGVPADADAAAEQLGATKLQAMQRGRLARKDAAKGGKNKDFDSGGRLRSDPKDSDDFGYLTYAACPAWNTDKDSKLFHKSLMAKNCTPELFAKLKDVTTATGYTFSNAIQTGVETPHLGVGLTAGDEECYEAFAEIINPIIAGWHGGYDPTTMKHPTDLEPENLTFSDEQRASFNSYAQVSFSLALSLRGVPFESGGGLALTGTFSLGDQNVHVFLSSMPSSLRADRQIGGGLAPISPGRLVCGMGLGAL